MKYPKFLELRISEIQDIIDKWPVSKTVSEVMTWVLQFDSKDYDIALRILRHLNVVSPDDLNSALAIAYSKLQRHAKENNHDITVDNTIYMSIGTDGKSGAMIAYNFRMINRLSSARFFSSENIGLLRGGTIKNVVLVDDIIATGDQSSEQVKQIAEKVLKLGIQNIYVVSAFGFKSGIEKLRGTQVVDVFSAIEYDECDTIESMDSLFYEGLPYAKRIEYKELLEKNYNGKSYGNMGALIAFYYNTPNCSLGSIWKSKNGWLPLYPRMFDEKAQRPELYELDKLIDQKDDGGNDANDKKKEVECAIYVEGKVMELFIREVAKRNDHFGYSSLIVVSIGPFYSDSLIEALQMHSNVTRFVTNEPAESQTQHASNIKKAVKESVLLRISSVMEYFDIEKIKSSVKFSRVIDSSLFDEEVTKETRNSILEMRLFKPQYRVENMQELIENCVNDEKMKELVGTFRSLKGQDK